MKVKICGITNIEDALEASELGADMLGFIFVKSSLRYITPGSAEQIIARLPQSVTPVGVFADMPSAGICKIIGQTGIKRLQLHGNETPEDLSGFPVPVIKSFRVGSDFDISILSKYTASEFLLDTFSPGELGGTGRTFDWKIAVSAKVYGRIILAGGLNPDNIEEAVRAVGPYAVDINSGVESHPGKKDKQKIKNLFQKLSKL